jgi:hypothetical protein
MIVGRGNPIGISRSQRASVRREIPRLWRGHPKLFFRSLGGAGGVGAAAAGCGQGVGLHLDTRV